MTTNLDLAIDRRAAIARAEDLLIEARNCVDCIWLAAEGLEEKAIQVVAGIANDKIDEAIAMLNEYRNASGAGPGADREAA
jgi:hypothetical protein